MKILLVGKYDMTRVRGIINPNVYTDVKYHAVDMESPEPRWCLNMSAEAALAAYCDMMIAFWDGEDIKTRTWIQRAKLAKKVTVIFYA